MKITPLNRITRWVSAHSTRAAPSDTVRSGVLSPAQTQRLLLRLRDLEWEVRGLTEQCSTLQQTASAHDWSLEAIWEKLYESRTPSAPASSPHPAPPKKTLN